MSSHLHVYKIIEVPFEAIRAQVKTQLQKSVIMFLKKSFLELFLTCLPATSVYKRKLRKKWVMYDKGEIGYFHAFIVYLCSLILLYTNDSGVDEYCYSICSDPFVYNNMKLRNYFFVSGYAEVELHYFQEMGIGSVNPCFQKFYSFKEVMRHLVETDRIPSGQNVDKLKELFQDVEYGNVYAQYI